MNNERSLSEEITEGLKALESMRNNEPVAYINKDDGLVCAKCFNPLYTHPAKTWNETVGGKKAIQVPCPDGIEGCLVAHYKIIEESAKTLTDEEILATFNPKFMCDLDDSDVIDFARAILRKAQEK
jgi:hypothetical protein